MSPPSVVLEVKSSVAPEGGTHVGDVVVEGVLAADVIVVLAEELGSMLTAPANNKRSQNTQDVRL